MADESLDEDTALDHAQRQTKALETLATIAWLWTAAAIAGVVLLVAWWVSS